MIAGKQYHGPAADTWSLGVILFALVCGHLPFEDPNTSNLYRKILSGEYKTPKWISPEVKDLIRRILETDPEKRLTIAQIRQHAWCLMVPTDTIPREASHAAEIEETKPEVFKRLEEIGLDVQAVMDAVSSHACNSLSAMFYLLSQKEQLKLRLSKKFSTNSARPETSDRNLLSGVSPIAAKSVETNPAPVAPPPAQGDTPKADPVRKVAPPPSKPQIPKLNIKPALQGGSSNPLVSQSARVDGTPQPQPRGQLAALQNPSPATARPVLTDQTPTPSHPPSSTPSSAIDQEPSAPKRGVIIRGTTIESASSHEAAAPRDAVAGVDLSIVANGLVQLPPVEAERPTTRRNKSRGGSKAAEGGGGLSPEEYRSDGPGMGKIPSADQISVSAGAVADTPRPAAAVIPKEPQAPLEPPKSGGGGSTPAAGGRRGKHLVQAAPSHTVTEEHSTHPSSNFAPTPPSKPKPSAATTLSDPRQPQGRPKPIQPLVARAPSAPSSKPPEVSARTLAQKNKQSQQGGSLSLSMETPPTATLTPSPPPPVSLLVS
jgi:serine/threonine protein kinase